MFSHHTHSRLLRHRLKLGQQSAAVEMRAYARNLCRFSGEFLSFFSSQTTRATCVHVIPYFIFHSLDSLQGKNERTSEEILKSGNDELAALWKHFFPALAQQGIQTRQGSPEFSREASPGAQSIRVVLCILIHVMVEEEEERRMHGPIWMFTILAKGYGEGIHIPYTSYSLCCVLPLCIVWSLLLLLRAVTALDQWKYTYFMCSSLPPQPHTLFFIIRRV